MAILPRYVLAEIAKVFLISMTALTLMVIIGFVGREAASQGLPLGPTLRLIPYFLPETLRVTVPMTLLLACTSVFARMAGANEVVAVKAMGISPMSLLWPVFILAFLLSLFTVWLNDLAVSWGRNNIQRIVIEAVEEIAYSMLQSQRRYSSSSFAINVKRVEGRRLLRPTVTIQGHGSSPNMTITAEEAELHSDRASGVLKLILRNGVIEMGGKIRVQFPDVHEQEIPLTDASRARASSPTGVPLWAITEETARVQAAIERHEQGMAVQATYQMICGDFDELTGNSWKLAEGERTEYFGRLYRLLAEPHRRWSAGFSCFCFAFVGAPMAIRLRNRDFLTSFFLCFVPILIVYYPLMIYGADQAKGGHLPTVSVWAGNALLVLWGLWLLRKVIRY